MPSKKNLPHNCLYVGNPGAGKSTLLNCLIVAKDPHISKKKLFKSGVSIGEGMTFKFDQTKVDGTTFMDTPGLEDTKLRKDAAEAISKALKQNGKYQVVFVVTLESGRVRPQDVTVVNLVLESAPEINRYGVIFNKLTKGVMREINNASENKTKLISQVSLQNGKGGNRPVPIPLFLPKIDDLEDENDVTTEIPALEEFMEVIPMIEIHEENVENIEIDKYQKYTEQLEAQLTELKNNNEQMVKRMQQDKEEYEKRMKEIIEEDKRRHAEEMKRIQEQNEKQMALLQEKEKEHREQMQKLREEDAVRNAEAIAKIEEANKQQREDLLEQQKQQKENQEKMFEQMKKQHNQQIEYMEKQQGGPGIFDGLKDLLKVGLEAVGLYKNPIGAIAANAS